MTREELAARVDNEGGIWEAVFHYGLTVEDLPDDVPHNIAEAWYDVQKASYSIGVISRWLWPRES